MPKHTTIRTKPPTPAVPSTLFCADDADVVLRAAGSREFRVHKPVLSLVSPVFKDMFTLPQPTDALGTLPHVDVEESVETWENILQTIYPIPNPIIDNLHDLERLLLAAKKYEMQFVIDFHIKTFKSRGLIQRDPLHLYAIACTCGFDNQAKHVARRAERLVVTRRTNPANLKGLTVESYHQLVSFLTDRDNEWYQVLGKTPTPYNASCRCDRAHKDRLYNNIKEHFKVADFQIEEIYLKALEDPIRTPDQLCAETGRCSLAASEIKAFINSRAKEAEAVRDKLMW